MKLPSFKTIVLLTLIALALTLTACDNNTPVSPARNGQPAVAQENARPAGDTEIRHAEANGPVPNEVAAAVQAPAKRVTKAPGELKIVKALDAPALGKRFIASWYVSYFAGGWIYAGDAMHGYTYLYFPAYALNQSSIITIDWESTGLLEGGVDFSPEGTQFNTPVTVWISYKDVNLGDIPEENLRIWYWNEAEQVWELIGDTVDTQNKMVGGLLHHFSRYALGAE